jgi:hypothetical protein
MKKRNLIQIGLVIILLAGVGLFNTNSAMARNDCPDGTLTGGNYDEIVIDTFTNCSLLSVVIRGNVQITGADNIEIIACSVSGELEVSNSLSASLVTNQVLGGDVVVYNNRESTVINNVVNDGSMLAYDDFPSAERQIVEVRGNIIINGSLGVNGNETAIVRDNNTRNGDITCENNDHLDSWRNNAFGGRENCSESLFN